MPRKTSVADGVIDDLGWASMRPRPDAAENGSISEEKAIRRIASMRPRPDAAENAAPLLEGGSLNPGFNEAAARCRGKPKNAESMRSALSKLQ